MRGRGAPSVDNNWLQSIQTRNLNDQMKGNVGSDDLALGHSSELMPCGFLEELKKRLANKHSNWNSWPASIVSRP